MKINNPEVTLSDEIRAGVEEDVRSGFLDWLHQFSVTGDDGELYSLGGAILSMNLEKMDVVSINIAKGTGNIKQLKDSIYKIGEYPGMLHAVTFRNPAGTLQIEKTENSAIITCGAAYKVECFNDNSWHLELDTMDGIYKADLWHRPHHAPLWYGREKPSFLTQHSITYGYNWTGEVSGSIILNGKTIQVSGAGIRERYVAVDSCAAEIGGWEDWGWLSFNEIHSSMFEFRLGMKDFAVYDLQTKRYYPEGKMDIEHEDWIFLKELDGFVPATYRIRIETEDGLLETCAHIANVTTWGATGKVPDNPVATLTFGSVEGRFIDNDGNVRNLSGGRGTMSIRQWHPYPRIFPTELQAERSNSTSCDTKFDTL